MVFNLRARVPRLAGQPSTFYVLLNALIFTALIHYWSGWAWSGRSNWANSPHEHDDDGHVAPPPPVQQQPPPPKPVAPAPKIVETPTSRLPAFCDVCGPEDVWCSKFGSVSNTRVCSTCSSRLTAETSLPARDPLKAQTLVYDASCAKLKPERPSRSRFWAVA